jgi:plasmid stabilization system protein ParE
LAWLAKTEREDLIPGMTAAVEEVVERLQLFPEIGGIAAESPRLIVRKILFRRRPYVVWYGHRRGSSVRTLWLLRVFHVRQSRPRPRATGWRLE